FRNFAKRKIYAILNGLGLAVSIAISYLLWLYVQNQYSYDHHFNHADRIYRVGLEYGDEDKVLDSFADIPVAATLKTDYSEVETATSLNRIGQQVTLANQNRFITSRDVFASDPYFFDVFEAEFVEGNQKTALFEPNSIVISESYALRLFDSTNVVGNIIQWSGERAPADVEITGVIKDLDKHSHLPLEALVSFSSYYDEAVLTEWARRKAYTYVKLNETNDIEGLKSKIPTFIEKYLSKRSAKTGQSVGLSFQPLTAIYLDPERLWEPYPHGNRTNVQIISIIILSLLLIACINYVNLATALGIDRAKEVGIKKTLGSSQFRLFTQFMLEAILLALLAGVLALLFSATLLPFYTDITDIPIDLPAIFGIRNTLTVLLVSMIIGCLAGIYPAMYLSSLTPNIMLTGKFKGSDKGIWLRKSLITLQYVVSSVLIIGILIVNSQTTYITNKNIGYDKKNLIQLAVPDDHTTVTNVKPFLNEIRANAKVKGASLTEFDLHTYREQGDLPITNHEGFTTNVKLQSFWAGRDFIKTIGATITKGRGFGQSFDEGDRFFLVNETAVKAYGWENHETELRWSYVNNIGETIEWESIGVVSDFILGASHQKQKPMIILFDEKSRSSSNIFLSIENGEIMSSINQIEKTWKRFFPNHSFEFQFVKDNLNALYQQEKKFLSFLSILCFVTIFITTLGIIGLISFTTEMKRKEIAIRKVNGAHRKAIIKLLSKQFVLLLLTANMLAIPIGYYLINQWLANFEQRIDLTIWPFISSVVICLTFTTIALLYHTVRAARENPIYALQYE
ncbi:MAG: FtsX-like permease family protein, partial [Bacteroidota bacterium]